MNDPRVPERLVTSVPEIKRSTARGVVFVTARQIVVQSANVLGTVLLMRTLTTSEFGLYAILIFLSQSMALLGGTALALQVVRSPTPLPKHALRVLFTAQFALSLLCCIVLWIAAPAIAHAYHLGNDARLALRIVSIAALLACFQTMPVALLERDLKFERLAISEISQALIFNCIAVAGAWAGFGVRAVAVAILSRIIIGALVVNGLQRWPWGLALDFEVLRSEIGSGAAYLGSAVVSAAKDAINPVFVGLLLGAADVGLVNWANTVASYCVIALMMMQRLYIPTFSRMAVHPQELGRFVTNVIKATNAVAAPVACLVLVFIHPITTYIFGQKWLGAIPAFYLFWIGNLIVPTITPLMSLLQALNRGSMVLYASLMWMCLTWAFGAPAILELGVLGAGLGNCLVQCSNLVVLRIVKRHVDVKILPHVLPIWMVAATAALISWLIAVRWPARSAQSTLVFLAVGGAVYLALMVVFRRDDVRIGLRILTQGLAPQSSR